MKPITNLSGGIHSGSHRHSKMERGQPCPHVQWPNQPLADKAVRAPDRHNGSHPYMSFAIFALMLFAPSRLSGQAPAPGLGAAPKEAPKPAASPRSEVTSKGPENSRGLQSPGEGFYFEGGNLLDFIKKLREQFGKDVVEVIDVRDESLDLRVPKMKVPHFANLRSILHLYNQASADGDGFLGKWYMSPFFPSDTGGVDPGPTTVIFFPPKPASAEGGDIQVRAFSVRGLSEERLSQLRRIIEVESDLLRNDIANGRFGRQEPSSVTGRVNVHPGSGLLVAAGGKTYVDLVATLIDGFTTTSEKARSGEAPEQPKPKEPKVAK